MNKRIAAFKFAFEGVIDFFTNHYHPKIHLAFAIIAVTFAFILGFSAMIVLFILLKSNCWGSSAFVSSY